MATAPEATISITGCRREISGRPSEAAAVPKAAVICAESRSEHDAAWIVLEREEMPHEMKTPLNGVTLVNRKEQEKAIGPEPDLG